jgi:hypothetical protein
MTIDGTKGAPHHEEHWTILKGLTNHEVTEYVMREFGLYGDDPSNPVGFSYGPQTGELVLFRQVATVNTKPIGARDREIQLAARAGSDQDRLDNEDT